MNRIGFPRPLMEEEKRIALLPKDLVKIESPNMLFFQKGYGKDMNISDEKYREAGANIVSQKTAYNLEVLCQPKFCEEDLKHLNCSDQIIFGWLHLEENGKTTKELIKREATAFAWEEMFYENGQHVFKKNNLLTGKMGVLHAVPYAGKVPEECDAAVIGRGQVGQGAIEALKSINVQNIAVYHRRNVHVLREHINKYDLIVHCACSPDIILKDSDLKRMKKGALFVHLGADSIEGDIHAQSVYSPVKELNNGRNLVYCVNHVPTIAYKTASEYISHDVAPYVNMLTKGLFDKTLINSAILIKGRIVEGMLAV
jgi:N5-(carboxyethyl)ornithine synthase